MKPSPIKLKAIAFITVLTTILTISSTAIAEDNENTGAVVENFETSIQTHESAENENSEQIFTDIAPGKQYFVSTKYLKENGIINGYDDGSFKPNQELNRAEALKMLMIASDPSEEIDSTESIESGFTDVESTAWYAPYIAIAKEKGVINGYTDGTFKPTQEVNLAEALKIYIESLNITDFPEITDYSFIDTSDTAWYAKYIALAGQKTLLDIYPSGKIYPEQKLERGYLADIIYKMQKSNKGSMFGKATFYGKALQGNYTASGEIFDYNLMTAAHKTLPLGTMVEVTNLANGKKITVKVNDRGPYGHGRVLDLSSGAFEEIAWLGTGIINIEYKIINE